MPCNDLQPAKQLAPMLVVVLENVSVPAKESQAKNACDPMVERLLGNTRLRKLWREWSAFLGMFGQLAADRSSVAIE